MKIAVFSTHKFEQEFLIGARGRLGQADRLEMSFFEVPLNHQTAALVRDVTCVCCFVSDQLDRPTIKELSERGVRLIALRCAGFNNVDLAAAAEYGVTVVRVPSYSPHAIAEHAVALLLSLNRKIPRAHSRVRELNFSLEQLVGFDLNGKTVGVIGMGKIGAVFAKIMKGFGCRVLAYDVSPDRNNPDVEWVSLDEVYRAADIISLHVPLLPSTRHMLNSDTFNRMKPGVYILNTGRGALIDTVALIEALKSGQVGAAGLDVYEEEEGIFFEDHSAEVLKDDVLARLLTFPNVLITSHQAFLTKEALTNIAETTVENIAAFGAGRALLNEVKIAK